MRDTPGLRPLEPSSTIQLTSTQPTTSNATFRRLVTVNQELAQHNAKVRCFSQFFRSNAQQCALKTSSSRL
jgi:hypothetical protein